MARQTNSDYSVPRLMPVSCIECRTEHCAHHKATDAIIEWREFRCCHCNARWDVRDEPSTCGPYL